MLDIALLKDLSQLGTNVLLIIGIIFLWRAYQAIQKSYEVLLVKCTEALVRVAEHLGEYDAK